MLRLLFFLCWLVLPCVATAQELNIVIPSLRGESFENWMQKAESEAINQLRQAFAGETGIVRLNVMGERDTIVVPLMILELSRAEWLSQSGISAWTKFSGSKSLSLQRLLGFTDSAVIASAAPVPMPILTPPQGVSFTEVPRQESTTFSSDPNDEIR